MQNEMAEKLDILMNIMFEYIKKACYNEGMSCKTDVDLPSSRISFETHVDNLPLLTSRSKRRSSPYISQVVACLSIAAVSCYQTICCEFSDGL
jgi:hypothetical protein